MNTVKLESKGEGVVGVRGPAGGGNELDGRLSQEFRHKLNGFFGDGVVHRETNWRRVRIWTEPIYRVGPG